MTSSSFSSRGSALALAEPPPPHRVEALIAAISELGGLRLGRAGGTLTISNAARMLGTTTRALRHYEDEGLLRPRRNRTLRIYDEDSLRRADVIIRLRNLGLSIPEIAEVFTSDEPERRLRPLLQRVIEELRWKREWAETLDRQLHVTAPEDDPALRNPSARSVATCPPS